MESAERGRPLGEDAGHSLRNASSCLGRLQLGQLVCANTWDGAIRPPLSRTPMTCATDTQRVEGYYTASFAQAFPLVTA
jgi:hypothetical protein